MAHTASSVSHSGSGTTSILSKIKSDDVHFRIQAAKEIRKLAKNSSTNRRLLADAILPLVSMLEDESEEENDAAILALLNLAVQDESNKTKIMGTGALDRLISFLRSPNTNLQEHAAAAILTLSASPSNKLTISSYPSCIPFLIQILQSGTPQAKSDAIGTLHNLSSTPNVPSHILSSCPIPPIIKALKTLKKSSKTAEKCTALLETLMDFDDARKAIAYEPGGVFSIVEALEDGSSRTKEHAAGALLVLCRSDRCKYREIILKEGVIPGLLELTVYGTDKGRLKAKELLEMLRSTGINNRVENIANEVVSRIECEDRSGKAKRMLEEMVKVSMEQSLRHLERRASSIVNTSNT